MARNKMRIRISEPDLDAKFHPRLATFELLYVRRSIGEPILHLSQREARHSLHRRTIKPDAFCLPGNRREGREGIRKYCSIVCGNGLICFNNSYLIQMLSRSVTRICCCPDNPTTPHSRTSHSCGTISSDSRHISIFLGLSPRDHELSPTISPETLFLVSEDHEVCATSIVLSPPPMKPQTSYETGRIKKDGSSVHFFTDHQMPMQLDSRNAGKYAINTTSLRNAYDGTKQVKPNL
ncbi:hypothetical protein KSP40_PGU017153 [Platanthera guangdongensis]|uniref:Uncharacterized protein n=1 Tax=Platanthera guangdongensis TaxID=2320717 RepID=A0ABR2M768_9ASPA